jgi:uncharacterized repeat protein (TIGR01451 family)
MKQIMDDKQTTVRRTGSRRLLPAVAALAVLAGATASAHNLDTRATSINYAADYLALMSQRAGDNEPLVQVGDEFWVVIKTTPGPGTTTGVGGYQTFYVPPWARVLDAAYVLPDPSQPNGYAKIPMKGQSPIAIGAGPIGAKSTPELIGFSLPGTNGLGFVTEPVTAAGLHRGTIAGVYADTGIFYSTDPRTAFNTYGAALSGGTPPLVNNSGDTVGEWDAANVVDPTVLGVMTLWDSYQLRAYGNKAGPIIDYPDQRGNAPWGLANVVAGPLSGYAWEFNYGTYLSTSGTAAQKVQAAIQIGPWQRVQYPGGQIASDQPGLISSALGYAAVDASTMGYDVSPANPLPTDTKAVRFAIGQLELGRPEFSAVKVKILSNPSENCAKIYGDAFGGDAGGTDGGKDHIWRYFDPTVVSLSPCTFLQKTVSKALVAPGEVFYYTIVFANNGSVALPNITLRDTLPSGVTFVSAMPPPTSVAAPAYTWNLGTVQPGSMVVITNWVKAASLGTHFNNVTAFSGAETIGSANQAVEVGYRSLLQKTKTVTPAAIAAGETVDYTITVSNEGTGGNGVPLIVRDYLPSGFTFANLLSATLNGAAIASPTISVSAADPAVPVFTVSQAIQPGKTLVVSFRARAGGTVEPGSYFNNVEMLYEGKRQPPIPEAMVTVAGGKIGDTVFRDWDGDGAQDAGEAGVSGLTVKLYAADGTTLLATTTTDASGHYYFPGLTAGTYVVKVNDGATPAGYTQTADPDGTVDNMHTVVLTTDEQYLAADFGYRPAGTATIGDKVFEDVGKDGVFTPGSDSGIPNVTVWLYEDGNGNGAIDAGDALVATAQSDSNGDYLFSNLAAGFSYLVKVNQSDPDLQSYFNNKYDPDPVPYALSTAEIVSSPNLTGNDLDNDFGFWRVVPGSIGDQVFIDADGDGLYDAGETPLAGVTVTLYRNGQPVASAVTGSDGVYLFDNLGPGDYTVEVDVGSGGVPAGHSASVGQFTVTLASGEDFLAADFPFVPLISKTVDTTYAEPGSNLLFTVNVNFPGSELLSGVRVIDPLPTGVTYGSATAGGVYGPYASQPGTTSANTAPAVGMAVYNNNSDVFRYRTWNVDEGFSAEASGANMGTRIQMMAGASSPTTAERVVTFMDSARHVFAATWNGTAWTAVANPPASAAPGRMTSVALTANSHLYWGSAVAYEQSSGHLMLVWNDDANTASGTDDELRFVTRENGVWGTVASLSAANQPQNLRLAALPNSDQLALVYSTSTGADYVRIWSGTSWGAAQTLDTTGGALTSVNVAYETQSGRAMVVYGKPTATSPNLFFRLWNGSSWSAEASITPPAGVVTQPQWVAIAADPYSNRIAAGVVTGGGRTWLAVWNGSAWVNVEQATATSLIATAQNVAVAFETFSGDILAAYGVNGAPTAQVRYRTWSWNPVAQTGTWSGELLGPTATSGNPNVIMLTRSPTTDRVMMSLNTSGNRANYVSWDGSAWDESVLDAGNTQVPTQQPMIYLWNRASAEPSSTTSLTASPTTAAVGAPITVTLSLKSSHTITNVTPTLAVMGGSAVIAPAESFPVTVIGGVTRTITYTVTPTSAGDIHFHATATGGTGYDFGNTDSNTVLVSPNGATHAVIWDLGSNDPGTEGLTAVSKYLYAFAGNDLQAFWAFNTASGAWNNPLDPADTPTGVTVKEGGALTTDGSRYLYALRGDASRVFLRYDTTAGTWDDAGIADLPATTDKVVLKGGALTYLNGYVYAFIGNDSIQFWRYSVAGNSWTQMANAPGTVNNGAGLTTDGVNLYATQGDAKKGFWRYNVVANTWTALTPFADNIGDGGGLVYANGAIYVLRGDGKTTFRRYNIAANSWTTLAPAPANIDDGGAIGTDGASLYVLRGRSNGFYGYDPAANTWTVLATAPTTVQWGGALAFLASGDVTHTTASATPSLVGGVSQVVLRMTVTAPTAVNNIAANTPTYTAVNGVTATFGSAALISADDDIGGSGDPVIYEWIATVTPGTTPGEITFTASNSAGAGASAKANSVLVTPALTFAATVNDPAPDVIFNTALINEDGEGLINNVPSVTTETYTTASIGDFVWHDADGDGIQDSGEMGLAGVRVEVYAADGITLLGSDTTDATGAYHVGGLTAGNYVVKVAAETYPPGYEPTTPGTLNVTLVAGEQYYDADFGLWPAAVGTGSIGDRLWLDVDNDGAQDAGEAGLVGITVILERLVDSVWTAVASQTTGTNGLYGFTALTDGQYRVTVDTNSVVASPYGGTYALGGAMAPTYDLDGTGSANSALVTLNETQRVYDTLDFGYNWSGAIGDTVWWDDDADGVQDVGEDPVTNAFVMVYFDFNGNGILDPNFGDYQIAYAITDANGQYLIGNLPPGPYLVDVYEDSLTSGGVRDIVPTTLDVVYRQLGPGEAFVAADFGYYQGARGEGNVFWDDNRNAYFEGAEPGLASVTVTLTGTDMAGNPVTRTTTTDANGHYTFLVPEGDYTLTYSRTDVLAIAPSLGDATTPTSYTFHAYPGEDGNRTSYDFGVDSSGSIGDTVFADVNNTPGQQAGEAGLAGVTVRLYANPDGSAALNGDETLLEVALTDAEGKYLFVGLADGNYLVEVVAATLPGDYATTPTTDPTGALDSQGTAMIAGGNSVLTLDFGYPLTPLSYSVSGTIYDDNGVGGGTAGNGTQDGDEPGLANARLTIEVGTNGVYQTFVVYTDANGDYELLGVPEGSDVRITVDASTLPNGAYVQTGDPDGAPLSGVWTITDLQANATSLDFGYRAQFGSVGGTVVDGDGNGTADFGEPALTNVTVTLLYAGTDGIFGTDDDTTTNTVTDANGAYSFTNLVPGNYRVLETDPAGYVSLADADGGNPNVIDVPSLQPGQNVVGRDFEDTPPNRALGDRVWHDVDGDGVQGLDEPALSNVVVRLYAPGPDGVPGTADDVLLASDTTDADGLYRFDDLAPGTYVVVVDPATLPAGFANTPSYDLDGVGTPHLAVVALGAAPERMDIDFGYGSTALFVISGQVRDDYDANGAFSDPDQPVGGVTVHLYSDPNGDGDPSDGELLATTVTGPDGVYRFEDVPNGRYVVVEVDPVTSVSTADTVGDNDNWIPVVIVDADSVGNDFLDAVDPSGYFYDTADGRIVPGGSISVAEPGAVILMDGSSGQYMFISTNTAQTTYTIAVTPPPGYIIDPTRSAQPGSFDPTDGPDPTVLGSYESTATPGYLVDYSAASNTYYYVFALAAGDPPVLNNNFPLVRSASIGNRVWDDSDGIANNGIQDAGETGLVGVVVTLYRLVDQGGGAFTTNEVGSTVTDADGAYLFSDLPPGDYVLRITPPSGYALSRRNAGFDGGTDSDFDQTTTYTAPITVTAGQTFLDVDAGFYYAPTLAVVMSFRAFGRDGTTAVQWEVAEEFDTLYYWLERMENGVWRRINPEAPAWSVAGEIPWGPYLYEVADPGAAAGGTYTWRLVEVENSGREHVYGPYTVTVDGAAADFDAWAAGVAWDGAAAGRDDDPDGDGLTNFEEYLAGTDPLSAESVLRITSLRAVPEGLEIRWPSAAGRVYAVEYVRDLGGDWLPVSPDEAATPDENRFVLPGTDRGFFRVVLKAAE